jgi:Domain of unknown function (DUF4429)/Short C-terminal domain
VAELFAKGTNGIVTIDGDWLTIDRKRFGRRARHLQGYRRIPLASITAVQIQPARVFSNGFIRFTVAGSPQLLGGLQSAMRDENAVTFRRGQERGFNMIRAAVEQHIAAQHAGARSAAGEPDIPEQIKRLGELRDQKLITDEEFEAKKAELLDRL